MRANLKNATFYTAFIFLYSILFICFPVTYLVKRSTLWRQSQECWASGRVFRGSCFSIFFIFSECPSKPSHICWLKRKKPCCLTSSLTLHLELLWVCSEERFGCVNTLTGSAFPCAYLRDNKEVTSPRVKRIPSHCTVLKVILVLSAMYLISEVQTTKWLRTTFCFYISFDFSLLCQGCTICHKHERLRRILEWTVTVENLCFH